MRRRWDMVKPDGARRGSTFVLSGIARVWGELVSAHTTSLLLVRSTSRHPHPQPTAFLRIDEARIRATRRVIRQTPHFPHHGATRHFPLALPVHQSHIRPHFYHSASPKRIPLFSLSHFISRIPFSDLYVLEQFSATIASSTSTEDKVHLVANLHMFIAPHYSKLGGRSLSIYLRFLANILNALPVSVFDPPREHIPKVAHFEYHSDSDDDEPRPRVSLVSSFNKPQPLPKLDSKTLTRRNKVVAPAHIDSLITSTRSNPDARKELVAFLSALTAV
ncbi:uncharacterized protein LACBIDRAFT_303043 [Laccaria bicolor S238N-H82]|uniref:Predicted protein n=1 Tax=Laccaria bicolor (strain S238N-H82 / ATCC MYA-4686) TaxID=486041 RepID=B0DIU0_LACBS|nr:uncharacterized protein LACBIDRAFT_303043 [Laccaria bicolor S238N-H82]EDR05291.1 predicted protein [Laccaria bicolor S238N-H82]|eukprot:XP_001883849.1 predicted protein [Laccaria bicolor S238N-H82]